MENKTKWHSCRLAVHGDSGRVRWCVGHERTWQSKLKGLVFVPAILLSIVLLSIPLTNLLVLSHNKNSLTRSLEEASYEDNEVLDMEERRDILKDTRTSYIPSVDAPLKPSENLRNRRLRRDIEVSFMDNFHTNTIHTTPPPDDRQESREDVLDIASRVMKWMAPLRSKDVIDYDIHNDTEMDIVPLQPTANNKQTRGFWNAQLDSKEIRTIQAKIMKSYMNTNIDPCTDFYHYACGNWHKHNQLPPDRTSYDTFEILRENLDVVLNEILSEKPSLPKIPKPNDATIKARNLYKSCMNEDILKARGEKPLLRLLEILGGWPIMDKTWDETKFDMVWLIGQLRLFNNDILISEWIGPDIKNSDEYIIQIDQTTLGLPSRDYFLDASNAKYLEAYRMYMTAVAKLLGAPPASVTKDIDDIITFEKFLARITHSPEGRKNLSDIYHRTTLGRLILLVPQIDWIRYFNIVLGRSIPLTQPIVSYCQDYLHNFVILASNTSRRTIANYLLWRFVRHRVNNLDERFQEAKQKFYYVLFGREKSPPRWQVCVSQVNSNLGMAVGSLFVKKYFDETSKNDTLAMTKVLQQSFREILQKTNWLDPNTKRIARSKIDAMNLRIGYPDFVLDPKRLTERYKDVLIHPDYYFENMLSILKHLTKVEQSRLGTVVNKTLWNTAPAIVNAYYSRNKNQIMFPAGILQPPFYHRHFPHSLNFGGIGVVIGHEITHGFDDKGRLFDQAGNLQRWWQDCSIDEFHRRAQCLISQYNSYVIPELEIPLDGVITQGENIADNGGIKQAYKAYKKWMQSHKNEEDTLPGLNMTGDQLFFLNFAQVWCGSTRPEALRNKLKTAVHSPGRFRVIGALSNSLDFARVYNCTNGTAMNPVKKCGIW